MSSQEGTRVYRMTGPVVLWWVWVALVVLAIADLVVQGRDLLSLRFAFGVLTVTGVIFACALWPRVTAGTAGITVRNPFRDFDIPWGAVRGIFVGDAVQVQCARTGGRKDKTVHCWALTSSRRARARNQLRAQRGGRRLVGSDHSRLPDSARALVEASPAELIARELAQRLDENRPTDGDESAVLAMRWAWQPLAAVLVPAAALAISQFAR